MYVLKIKHYKIYCAVALSQSIVNRALKVSLFVGSMLNLINQGDVLLSLHIEDLNITKFLLTYFIPYSVTTYTATAMKIEFQIGTKSIIDADLKCRGCGGKIHVKKDALIPECSKCGIHTQWRLQ